MKGSFLIARKSFESDLWRLKPLAWWKIWCYLLGSVQHKDFKELKRGQGYFNFRELVRQKALGMKISYSTVDHFLRYAEKAKMLAKQKATWGTLITVRNYDKYQTLDNYKSEMDSEVKSEQIGEVEAKWKRNKSDNINKYVKNDIYEPTQKLQDKPSVSSSYKENVFDVKPYLSYYYTKFGVKITNISATVPALRRLLKSGYTQEDIFWGLDQLSKDTFWKEKGFDFLTVVKQLPKLKQAESMKQKGGSLYDIPRG